MSEKRPEIILIRETARQGFLRDLSTVVSFFMLIGIGILLDSAAMQWVGAILGFFTIVGRVMQLAKDNRMTTDQARKRLDEIDAAAIRRGN